MQEIPSIKAIGLKYTEIGWFDDDDDDDDDYVRSETLMRTNPCHNISLFDFCNVFILIVFWKVKIFS